MHACWNIGERRYLLVDGGTFVSNKATKTPECPEL